VAPGVRARHGKIFALARLLEARGAEVEADFRSYYNGLDLRDLWRPGGGASKLTHRLALSLVEQLPPESRTKTAERDELDPYELAEQVGEPRRGWGPWGPYHEMIAQLGERLDYIAYLIVKTTPGATGAKEPHRWRRPGVLGAQDLAVLEETISAPVVASLEDERADRERRRREKRERRRRESNGG
jgi:hypothetical protein